MGASCSRSALSRYRSVKQLVQRRPCLTFYAADGLLPGGEGPPILLFGEDHFYNESQQGGQNCLLLLDIAKEISSTCNIDEAGAEVIFLYENSVIEDNYFFESPDANDWDDPEDEFNVNITGTRHKIRSTFGRGGGLRLEQGNVKPVPMDVFGRIRLNLSGLSERSIPGPITAINEIMAFWKSVGYNTKYIRDMTNEAIKLATEHAKKFPDVHPGVVDIRDVFEMFMCVYLAYMAFEVNSETLVSRKGRQMAKREISAYVKQLFDPELRFDPNFHVPSLATISASVKKSTGSSEDIPYSEYRRIVLDYVIMDIVGICGDAIIYEYLTSMAQKKNTIIMMHAGYEHVNRIRRWLLVGEYNSDYERVSKMAMEDTNFVQSRNRRSILKDYIYF